MKEYKWCAMWVVLFVLACIAGIFILIRMVDSEHAKKDILVEGSIVDVGTIISVRAIPVAFNAANKTEIITDQRRIVVAGLPQVCFGKRAWIEERASGDRVLCIVDCTSRCLVMW